MIIVEEIIGTREVIDKRKVAVDLEWFECEKSRMKKTAEDGTEFGIAVAKHLKAGDILWENELVQYFIRIKPTTLTLIEMHDKTEAARIAFELGNRHLSLKIEEDQILVPYDEPTFLYLQKMGFTVRKISGVFSGYMECRAHGHHHE